MNKDSKLYYYFGTDENGNYPAVKLRSAVMAGTCGYGKTATINSMLTRTLMTVPSDQLDIIYHDLKGTEIRVWMDSVPEFKQLPHFFEMSAYNMEWEGDKSWPYISGIFQVLDDAVEVAEKRAEQVDKTGSYTWGEHDSRFLRKQYSLIIIDEYQMMNDVWNAHTVVPGDANKTDKEWFNEVIGKLLSLEEKSGIYVFLSSQSTGGFLSEENVQKFGIRITTKVDEKTSQLFLESPVAAQIKDRGVIYVKQYGGVKQRLAAPYVKDEFIKALVQYYATDCLPV